MTTHGLLQKKKRSLSPSTGPSKKDNAAVRILNGENIEVPIQKKILHEFRPFMDGYFNFKGMI
jgi:hypothetical protein